MTLFYIPFLHPRRSKDLLGVAVSHLPGIRSEHSDQCFQRSSGAQQLVLLGDPQQLPPTASQWHTMAIVNRIDAEQEYYFLNPN